MQNLKEFTIYTKKYLTIEDSYALLANAEALGMSEKIMVENAGSAVAEQIKRKYKDDRILFLCGPGGKGAIGMATARHLISYADVEVALVCQASEIRNAVTQFNYGLLKEITGVLEYSNENPSALQRPIKKSDDIVDAMVGIGMHGKLSGNLINAIKSVNRSNKQVLSIDVPTGINADTGSKNMDAVSPNVLFAIHKMKKYEENLKSGYSINVVNIGLPAQAELFTGPGDVMVATKPRFIYANKYDHGRVLILGGSSDYKGAPLLSGIASEHAMAALRTGSGYVTVLAPEGSSELISKMTPELIIKPISAEQFTDADMAKFKLAKHDALIIGPGLPQGYIPIKMFASILAYEKSMNNPVLVDAEGIRIISQDKSLINRNMIITPHEGEFKYLSGVDLKGKGLDSKIQTSVDFAKNYGSVLVLKGNETIVTDGKLIKINKSKTPTLATMGTGDVLAGIIASYAAVGHDNLLEAAAAGVYLHSKIGDALFESKGLHATAYDVANAIPEVLKSFDRIRY